MAAHAVRDPSAMGPTFLTMEPAPAPESDFVFDYSVENDPNADILLPSLRQSGYTLETAIGDLADNPLDKEGDLILVDLAKHEGDWIVSVADNGTGMDLMTLDQMMRLGSRAEHDLEKDLGKFGLGSTTASLSLGQMQHVITCCDPGHYLSAATDLKEIVKARRFVKHLADAGPSEVALFQHAFTRWDLDVPPTGTMVRILHCDNIGRTSLGPAVASVKRYLGQTYRHFIWAGKRFMVNGELVEAIDPLDRNNPETRKLLEDFFMYEYPKGHPKAGQKEMVAALLVHLPDYGGVEANIRQGLNPGNAGFYVMRNRREIVAASLLGFLARHPTLSRFRGELFFPAALDAELGVSFLKSAWNIRLSQSLSDKVLTEVGPHMRQSREIYKKSLGNSSEGVPHDEAAKVIQQRSPFLRKPKTEIERRAPNGKPEPDGKEPHGDPKRHRHPVAPRYQKALADRASFEVKDLGTTAPFFEAELIGRKVLITYNGQHPFYERFILEQRDNRGIIAAIDYLVYSMATAEIMAHDDDTFRFIEKMREDTSFNLRQLLTT